MKSTPPRRWQTRARSITVQTILVLLLPLSGTLAVVLSLGLYAYQQSIYALVKGRDQELARVAAYQVSEEMRAHAQSLQTVADDLSRYSNPWKNQHGVLPQAYSQGTLDAFDAGLVLLDCQGTVSSSIPPDLQGADFSGTAFFQQARFADAPFFSDLLSDTLTSELHLVVAVPVRGRDDGCVGVLAAGLKLGSSDLGAQLQWLRPEDVRLGFMVDQQGRVIHHNNPELLGVRASDDYAVQRLLAGAANGATTVENPNGDRYVVGYARVDATGWGIVVREPLARVMGPVVSSTRWVVLGLLVTLLVTAGLMVFGVGRITSAVAGMAQQARRVAGGDYEAHVQPSQFLELRELAEAFNVMVDQIRDYQAGLRRYLSALTLSQEEERKRIARDLHDDTVQALIAIGQRLELTRALLSNNSEAAQTQLTEARAMVRTAVESVRQFSRDLRPPALEDLGLTTALRQLADDLTRDTSLAVEITLTGDASDLPPDLEIAVYRIIQEALANVRKHAQASSVRVVADFGQAWLTLRVTDDGMGFVPPTHPADLSARNHFGLMGVAERVELWDGTWSITAAPGQGTSLEICIPRDNDVEQAPPSD
jgi:signal transduction histidine kinase